jgi:hypothetical protein
MSTINYCIPFIGIGVKYMEFLVENLYATAEHPGRISVSVSVHSEADAAIIRSSGIASRVRRIVTAPPYPPTMRFNGSANHARAINALAAQADADIVVFSDYDMAFATRNWDSRIETLLQNADFCGVAYPPVWLKMDMPELPWAKAAPLAKYQGKPNLSFFAITRQCLEGTFSRKLTAFDTFLAAGCLPFQIINTPQMARMFGLPPGSILWMDTGYELPMTIEEKGLRFHTFMPVEFDKQTLFANRRDFYDPAGPIPEQFALPEIFVDSDPANPFLVHFKKGTAKADHNQRSAFENFMRAVDAWLAKQ